MALTETEKEKIAEEEELRVEIRTRAYLRNFSYSVLLALLFGIGLFLIYTVFEGNYGLGALGLVLGYIVIFLGTYLFLRRLERG